MTLRLFLDEDERRDTNAKDNPRYVLSQLALASIQPGNLVTEMKYITDGAKRLVNGKYPRKVQYGLRVGLGCRLQGYVVAAGVRTDDAQFVTV